MNLNTQFIDKVAISFSSLCLAHCLIFPIFAAVLPSLIASSLTSESFHLWMVICVVPSSIFALTLGCKKHAEISVVVAGLLGLSLLLLTLLLGHDILGEYGEKLLTLIGAILIAFAHIKNYKLCQQQENCECDGAHS